VAAPFKIVRHFSRKPRRIRVRRVRVQVEGEAKRGEAPSKIYIGPTENRVCENAFLIGGWAGEGDKHLGHNHRRHHQHQYHRHVVAPAKSLDARKHAPPAVSSISSSVSGSLRSRSPPRRVLLPSPFRPRSSFLFISRHHLLSLALHPALPPRPPVPPCAPFAGWSLFVSFLRQPSLLPFLHLLFCDRCLLLAGIRATLSPPCLRYHISSSSRALAYSRLAVREGSRPVRRLIYESHASNPLAPWGTANDMCFSTLEILYPLSLPRSRIARSTSRSSSRSDRARSCFMDTIWEIERGAE